MIMHIDPDVKKIKELYEKLLSEKPENFNPIFMGDNAEISFDTKQ